MCDIYEVMDRWGAWAATDRGVVDWQPIAAGFEKLYLTVKNLYCSVTMMKASCLMVM